MAVKVVRTSNVSVLIASKQPRLLRDECEVFSLSTWLQRDIYAVFQCNSMKSLQILCSGNVYDLINVIVCGFIVIH